MLRRPSPAGEQDTQRLSSRIMGVNASRLQRRVSDRRHSRGVRSSRIAASHSRRVTGPLDWDGPIRVYASARWFDVEC